MSAWSTRPVRSGGGPRWLTRGRTSTGAGHLARWGEQGEILVGIERPEGRLVDRILEAGSPIVMIPTFAMKDPRRRYAVSGAKSDPGDAYVIADVVRTDGHRLRRLEPFSEQTRALRSVVRARDDLVDQRVALSD